ncbi:NAD(P)/FAD-dependent oxidoreductase [Arcanobacterium haemolyticum]|nr:NAD(P)/FAD-dependent oxidoreductase [Arcanobacterium haemolyticum]
MTIGIVGWGIAGLRVAAELRGHGFDGTIVVWNDDDESPYDRPPLSKDVFGDYLHRLADDGLGDADELGLDVRGQATAIRQDGESWIVTGDDSVPVDSLVIASGAAPLATIPGAHTLYTREDAEAIRAAVAPGSRVHVVGAGWIGTEIAGACAERGANVELWEASPHILGRTFHGQLDDLWEGWLLDAGVNLHLGTPYPELHPDCDVLIQATGARPRLDFLTCGLRSPRGGVAVTLEGNAIAAPAAPGAPADSPTTLPGLYAAGDCADTLMRDGSWRFGGHWTQALSDAARVARTILGLPLPARLDAPEVFSTQYGHEIGLIGTVPASVTPTIETTSTGTVYRWHAPNLVALLGIDSPREVSKARKALRLNLG